MSHRGRRTRPLMDNPPTPDPSPEWGCCGCGYAPTDIVTYGETYCWRCASKIGILNDGPSSYRVFPGRQQGRR